ncbi:MAG: ABC transporter ATP-binding protein [Bacteroidetes bacterium]|nr:ABC transporter ATP-binding protein [Bacteroidota bacterium]
MSIAISIKNLVKEYPRKDAPPLRAVDDISFDVEQGQIFGLLGPNGAGKSTAIKIMSTLIPPTSGTVLINGFDIVKQSLDVRKSLCVVLQENALEVFLTVRNNFLTFGRFHGMSSADVEKKLGHVTELFGLEDVIGQKPIDLSGGVKRRVQVAKMFLVDTPIVFLDEATTGMDTFNKRATVRAIREEAQRGRTIVLTTHMLEEAEELCSAIAIINHGKIVANGTTDDVKKMGLQMFYLSLKFNEMGKELEELIQKFAPVKIDFINNEANITVREHSAALNILSLAQSSGALKHFEISTASLEDVFVELIDGKGRRKTP